METAVSQHSEASPDETPFDEANVDDTATSDGAGEDAVDEAAAGEPDGDADTDPGADVVDLGAADDEGVALVGDETMQLRDTVAALEARLKAVSAAYRQQSDEIQATKDRLARQASIKEEMRRGEVVGTLFEPVENLKRSIATLEKEGLEEQAKGLGLVLHQFMDAFKKLGLEEVPGRGARFDPNLHEALTTMPVQDKALDDVVVEVFDTGYRIGSRLLKPARVIIGAYSEPEPVGEA